MVDDIAMKVTEVVRGDDLVPSTPRQLLLYDAFAQTPPRFCHVPLVVGRDGRRLAKRHGDLRLATLRERGMPAANVLGLLGWSCGCLDSPRPTTLDELLARFDLTTIPRLPFTFDDVIVA